MVSKISKIGIFMLVCLTLFFLVGCQRAEVEYDNDALPHDDSDDESETDNDELEDSGVDSESVKGETYWNHLRFSVDSLCMILGDEGVGFMEEHEWDNFAQEYGFDSMDHAQSEGLKYEGDSQYVEDYVALLEERCPSAIEFLEGAGEDLS